MDDARPPKGVLARSAAPRNWLRGPRLGREEGESGLRSSGVEARDYTVELRFQRHQRSTRRFGTTDQGSLRSARKRDTAIGLRRLGCAQTAVFSVAGASVPKRRQLYTMAPFDLWRRRWRRISSVIIRGGAAGLSHPHTSPSPAGSGEARAGTLIALVQAASAGSRSHATRTHILNSTTKQRQRRP